MNGVFGSSVLDVAIGLAYIYLLLALVCTTVNEWIAGVLNTRGRLLTQGLRELLNDQAHPASNQGNLGFFALFQAHPLITGLKTVKPGTGRLPAYISSANFANAVIDVATAGKEGAITYADLETGVKALPPGDVRTAVLALLQNCGNDLAKAQQKIEDWYTGFMDRVTGWYKRWVQIVTIVVALLLAATVNADSLRIARSLWQDSALRGAIAEQAKARAAGPAPTVVVEYDSHKKPVVKPPSLLTSQQTKALDQILGWRECPQGPWAWLTWFCGIAFTTVALSLGAPFWFDTLKRFVNMRTAGKSADERAQTPKA